MSGAQLHRTPTFAFLCARGARSLAFRPLRALSAESPGLQPRATTPRAIGDFPGLQHHRLALIGLQLPSTLAQAPSASRPSPPRLSTCTESFAAGLSCPIFALLLAAQRHSAHLPLLATHHRPRDDLHDCCQLSQPECCALRPSVSDPSTASTGRGARSHTRCARRTCSPAASSTWPILVSVAPLCCPSEFPDLMTALAGQPPNAVFGPRPLQRLSAPDDPAGQARVQHTAVP